MIIGRIVGWGVLIAGLSVLVRDLLILIDSGRWVPLSLGEAWLELDPVGFERTAGHWPDAAMALWSWVVLVWFGLVLLVLFRRRVRRRR